MSATARPSRNGRDPLRSHTSANGAGLPRIALRWPEEVAQSLGVSADSLQRHGVLDELRVWRLGSIRLVAVSELEQFVREHAHRVLEEDG